jgi:hypothetical protein
MRMLEREYAVSCFISISRQACCSCAAAASPNAVSWTPLNDAAYLTTCHSNIKPTYRYVRFVSST